jgi:hypothetical protein
MRARAFFVALAFQVVVFPAAGQSVTEAEARIQSAFGSTAEPGVLAEDVKLGPALQKALSGEKDRGRIYAALIRQIAGQPVRVSVLSPVEAALVGGSVSEPLVRLEAGELALLMRYSPDRKQVAFVEQLRAATPVAEPASPPPPVIPTVESAQLPPQAPKTAPVSAVPLPDAPQPRPAPVVPKVVETPKPPPAVAVQKPAPAESPKAQAKPRGECVIKPVMSEEDLWNCSGPTVPAALERLPAETKSQPAPPPATFKAAPAECEIKAVMTDDELRACGVRR